MAIYTDPRSRAELSPETTEVQKRAPIEKAPQAPKHVSPDPHTQEAPPEDQKDDPTAGLQPIDVQEGRRR